MSTEIIASGKSDKTALYLLLDTEEKIVFYCTYEGSSGGRLHLSDHCCPHCRDEGIGFPAWRYEHKKKFFGAEYPTLLEVLAEAKKWTPELRIPPELERARRAWKLVGGDTLGDGK